MALTLYVDAERWHSHLQRVRDNHPGIVPVAKGNGYGFGLGRLGELATWLGVDTVAVGSYAEIPEVSKGFDGTLLVLTPWRPTETRAVYDDHVVHTVGRLDDLRALTRKAERLQTAELTLTVEKVERTRVVEVLLTLGSPHEGEAAA